MCCAFSFVSYILLLLDEYHCSPDKNFFNGVGDLVNLVQNFMGQCFKLLHLTNCCSSNSHRPQLLSESVPYKQNKDWNLLSNQHIF